MSKSLIILCACFCLARPTLAWNSQGHMVVAQIAYNHLDPEVKAKCNALLTNAAICGSSSTSFVTSATWADQRCESGTSPQHYIDIPISLDGSTTTNVMYDPTNVVTAIQQEIAILQNPASTPGNQAYALRYLLHFVGDIQQPLHCSTGITTNAPFDDAGGNGFSFGSGNGQLHSFWDGGGGYLTGGASVSSNAAEVEAAYPYTKSVGSIPDPMDWAIEGHAIALTNTYVGITRNSPPSSSYTNSTRATTIQRMAIGGQRLAKLLNTLFVTNAPVVASATLTNSNFYFSWSTVSGRTYRVQCKQQITDAVWSNLTDITASANSITCTNAVTDPQRFYRAIVVN